MKAQIHKRKDVRGRIVGYQATIGPVDVDALSPGEATLRAELVVLETLERLAQGPKIETWQGHTIVVFPTVYGWAYWVSDFRPDYSCSGGTTREETITSAIHHLAQTHWTHEVNDAEYLATLPAALRADLARYFDWQREYRRLKDSGVTDDHTIRQMIGGFIPKPALQESTTV